MPHGTLLPALLFLTSMSVFARNYHIGIGDDSCGGYTPGGCFDTTWLPISVHDTVTFYIYQDLIDTGPHNVVADDGSFRCARGCDGEGGDGTPAPYTTYWSFTRTFNVPGTFAYRDEVSGAAGVLYIYVGAQAPFAIDPSVTGAWYDPAQSGHGLFIEVLPDNRFYASWFAFNLAGTDQAWFTGLGTYSGNTASITTVTQPTGGRWIPNFDPNQIVRNAWGTLTFTFTDCDHGRVDFSSVAGYGTGSMNLTRLTQPAGLICP